MKLKQTPGARQPLPSQMNQSLKILRLSLSELREYVYECMLENPVLETAEDGGAPSDALFDRLAWAAATDCQNAQYYREDGSRGGENTGCFSDTREDFTRDLLSQFEGLRLEPALFPAIRFLVERLDSRGWLDADIAAQAAAAGFSDSLFQRALTELQAAEPAGVGARGLTECLCLQIGRLAGDHSLAERIAADFLPALAEDRIGEIAEETGASETEVQAACSLIRRLTPYPCTDSAARERPRSLTPDVLLRSSGGVLEAVSNDEAIPQLRLSAYYLDLMRETADRETREYLLRQVNQAKWLVHSIKQRQAAVLRCARLIAEREAAFLCSRERSPKPLSLTEAARLLGMHEAALRRTVREKYIQAPSGIYPLRRFFTAGLEGGLSDTAKRLLTALVEAEEAPLSDLQLCQEMRRRGCEIAHRTVTKYRVELGIPSAANRG